MNVKYNSIVNFEGRNGFFKQSGLEIQTTDSEKRIQLFPLTSKGAIARCMLEIPEESLDDVIRELKYARAQMEHRRLYKV